ncbi:hypothetical protein BDZ91DRAFT_723054, partial [Kalaharituber pfeilii]
MRARDEFLEARCNFRRPSCLSPELLTQTTLSAYALLYRNPSEMLCRRPLGLLSSSQERVSHGSVDVNSGRVPPGTRIVGMRPDTPEVAKWTQPPVCMLIGTAER